MKLLSYLLCLGVIMSGAHPRLANAAPKTVCGEEPPPPTLELSTVQSFNASVDRFASYNKRARLFYNCIEKQGQKEELAISDAARQRIAALHQNTVGVQKRIGLQLKRLSAELAGARRKFSKK